MRNILAVYVAAIDRTGAMLAVIAAFVFLLLGFLICFEVGMRALGHPTKWTAEIAQVVQIWCIFLGAAFVLKCREMITVDILFTDRESKARKISESITLVLVGFFCFVVMHQGLRDISRSVMLGTRTDTSLSLPMWTIQLALPVGLALIFLQCMAELAKLWILTGTSAERKID